jgi:hypothetical protein
VLKSGGIAKVVFVDIGETEFPLAKESEDVEASDTPQGVKRALHSRRA